MDIARVGMGCIVFGGLEGWDGGGFLLFLLVAFEQLLDQEGDGAFALCGFADLGWRGESAMRPRRLGCLFDGSD